MNNRVAFITGGGGYIGGAIARQLAAEGIRIAICDIREEVMAQTIADIRAAGSEAIGFAADVRHSAEIDIAMADAVAHYGRLDIMIHTAGGSARSEIRNLVDQTDEVIERVLDVNLLGAFYASRAAARIMIAQGEGGKILNFSSTVGLNGLVGCVDYAAAKAGVMALTKALAKELGPHKINVISVAGILLLAPFVSRIASDFGKKEAGALGMLLSAIVYLVLFFLQ